MDLVWFSLIVIGSLAMAYLVMRWAFWRSKERVVKTIGSPVYGTISVSKKANKEVLLRAGQKILGWDARTIQNEKSCFHKIARIILEHLKNKKHVAVLYFGLGGGTIPYLVSQAHEGVVQTVVEIDPTLVKIVKEDFGLANQESIRIVEADAYNLAAEKHSFGQYFDVVMVDIFGDEESLANPASTAVSFIEYVRTLLKKEGILVFNHPAHTKQAVEGTERLIQNLESQGCTVKQYKVFDNKRLFKNIVVKVEF